jgi:hypothetical protein
MMRNGIGFREFIALFNYEVAKVPLLESLWKAILGKSSSKVQEFALDSICWELYEGSLKETQTDSFSFDLGNPRKNCQS